MTEVEYTNLSKQAVAALMMALQKSLLEQSDIVPVLEGFKITNSPEGLVVLNPPVVKFDQLAVTHNEEGWDVVSGPTGQQTPVDPYTLPKDAQES